MVSSSVYLRICKLDVRALWPAALSPAGFLTVTHAQGPEAKNPSPPGSPGRYLRTGKV